MDDETDKPDGAGIRYWAEFCAWSALVMTPIIWWLQGPSVSSDQIVVRTALVVISGVVAVGLRGGKLVRMWRAPRPRRKLVSVVQLEPRADTSK